MNSGNEYYLEVGRLILRALDIPVASITKIENKILGNLIMQIVFDEITENLSKEIWGMLKDTPAKHIWFKECLKLYGVGKCRQILELIKTEEIELMANILGTAHEV